MEVPEGWEPKVSECASEQEIWILIMGIIWSLGEQVGVC